MALNGLTASYLNFSCQTTIAASNVEILAISSTIIVSKIDPLERLVWIMGDANDLNDTQGDAEGFTSDGNA